MGRFFRRFVNSLSRVLYRTIVTATTLSPWFLLVLCVLATYRVTRFITRDAFPPIAWFREWIQSHFDPFDDAGWENYAKYTGEERELMLRALKQRGIGTPTQWKRAIAYLVTCAWCVSIYVAAVITVITALIFHVHPWITVLLWLTASAGTGLITQREPKDA